jgi:hypothetical protein
VFSLFHRSLFFVKVADERVSISYDDRTQNSDLVKVFIDAELVVWNNIEGLYGEALRQTKVFGPAGTAGVDGDIEEDAKHGKGDKRWQVLHDRIVEHVSAGLFVLRASFGSRRRYCVRLNARLTTFPPTEHPSRRRLLHADHALPTVDVPLPPDERDGAVPVAVGHVQDGVRQDRPTGGDRDVRATQDGRRGVERVEQRCRQVDGPRREELSFDRKGALGPLSSLSVSAGGSRTANADRWTDVEWSAHRSTPCTLHCGLSSKRHRFALRDRPPLFLQITTFKVRVCASLSMHFEEAAGWICAVVCREKRSPAFRLRAREKLVARGAALLSHQLLSFSLASLL